MARPQSIQGTAGTGVVPAYRDWKPLVVLAAMVAVFFSKMLLGSAWLWEDMMYYSYPVRVFSATSLAAGHLPLWNPFTFNGMPFLADIQTAVLYIPCLVLTLFVRNNGLDFYWLEVMIVAHYLLAGWGMYILASSFGLRRIPATFAAAAYMLSGFMIAHAIHEQVITLVAWYPLIVFLFRKSLTQTGWTPVFLCGLVLGHSTLAGYPQLSLYLHLFLGAYFVYLLLTTHRGPALRSRSALLLCVKAGIIVGVGLAIAAVQLLPTAELADLSQRAQITYEKGTEGSLRWLQLLTLYSPKLFGTAGAAGYHYWGPGTYWYYWETCIYLGILPFILTVLAVVVLRKNSEALFFGGVAVFVLLYALGDDFVLHRLFFDYIPGFSRFRNPARIGVFLTFSTSIISAFTLQSLMYGEHKPADVRKFRTALLVVTGAGLLLWVAVVTGSFDGTLGVPRNAEIVAALHRDANVAGLFLLLSAAVVFGILTRGTWSTTAALALPVVFFIDMFAFGADQNASMLNPMDYFHRADPIVRFLRNDLKNGLFRTNTRNQYGMIMDRNQGMVDRIPTTEGYTPLTLQRALPPTDDLRKLDLLNVKYQTVYDPQKRSLSLVLHSTYMPRAFMLYRFRVAHSDEELLRLLTDSTWDHRTTAILEKDPPAGFAAPDTQPRWMAQIPSYEDSRIAVDVVTPDTGLLVLSEIDYPGWRATVDGSETDVFRADYNLRAIVMPAGTHHVVFQFVHPPFQHGAWITGAALLACIAGITVPALRRQRSRGS